MYGYGWIGHKSGSGFSDRISIFNLQYCITIGSEATFLSALCVIRCPSYVLGPVPEVDVMAKRPQGLLNVGGNHFLSS
jgi:hypothetical protein